MKQKTLVIAFGNPLRRDDGVGYRAASLLSDALPDGAATVIFRQQLTEDLAGAVGEADRVIFIDAEIAPRPGAVSIKRLGPADFLSNVLLHRMTPADVLAWTKLIYGRVPRSEQVTVAGVAFDFGDSLTPPVEAALPALVETVKHLVSGRAVSMPAAERD